MPDPPRAVLRVLLQLSLLVLHRPPVQVDRHLVLVSPGRVLVLAWGLGPVVRPLEGLRAWPLPVRLSRRPV